MSKCGGPCEKRAPPCLEGHRPPFKRGDHPKPMVDYSSNVVRHPENVVSQMLKVAGLMKMVLCLKIAQPFRAGSCRRREPVPQGRKKFPALHPVLSSLRDSECFARGTRRSSAGLFSGKRRCQARRRVIQSRREHGAKHFHARIPSGRDRLQNLQLI